MLYLKPANFEDIEKEHEFVAAEPTDENGFINDYHGVSFEDFKSTVLPRMIDFSLGKNLPEGYVPETFYSSGGFNTPPLWGETRGIKSDCNTL